MYAQVVQHAFLHQKNIERKNNNIIFYLENGYYVSVLDEEDLVYEGRIISNCVANYREQVKCKKVGILALKQPSGKTIIHIEIKTNGSLAQNFAKGNSQIDNKQWVMIMEFFEKNSKKVDYQKLFGDAYVTSSTGGMIQSVSLCVPTSIVYDLRDGIKKKTFQEAVELKRFSLNIPKITEELKFTDKSDLTKWLQDKKNEISKMYDDLTEQINLTNSSDLYLSDEMKEKIFGSHKNSYLMKGEDYNLSEIDVMSYINNGVGVPAAGMPEYDEEMDPMLRNIGNHPDNDENRPNAAVIGIVAGVREEGLMDERDVEEDMEEDYNYEAEETLQEGEIMAPIYGNDEPMAEMPEQEPMAEMMAPASFNDILRRAK